MDSDLSKFFEKFQKEMNQRAVPQFEGYTPEDMHSIHYSPFSLQCPVQFIKADDSVYEKIPMLNQVKYLLSLINEIGELKLTAKGFLPTKIVAELYAQRFITDEFIEKKISKLYKETDSKSIQLTRILSELSGLAKKRSGKLSLTKKGTKLLADNHELFQSVFLALATKFNWGYFDLYENDAIGQLGFAFSIILLSKYGDKKRLDSFYAEKYLKAFPSLAMRTPTPNYSTLEKYLSNCYSLRTFDRFLKYFDLIKIEEERKGFETSRYVTKTDLFDKLIKVISPKTKLRIA